MATPQRYLQVAVHPAEEKIKLTLFANGVPHDDVVFTEDQAVGHARAVVDAIERLRAARNQPKLILPQNVTEPLKQ